MVRPVFDKKYKDMMDASLYMHDMEKLGNNLTLLKSAIVNANKKEVVTVSHVFTDSDSMRGLAIKYYGDVTLWRKLAIFNKIDTLDIVTGTIIEIPDKKVLNG